MLHATWTAGSLRFWVGLGIALAILPLLLSAALGIYLLDRGVIAAFDDVASRQRDQIGPNQNLRVLLWEAAAPIELYLDDGDPAEAAKYRDIRERVEAGFARLHRGLGTAPEAKTLAERARVDWSAADRVANEVIAVRWTPGDAHGLALARRFDALVASAADRLRAANDDIAIEVGRDHAAAALAYERSKWVAGIAAGVSLLSMVAGILVIGRFMLASVDRLVDGAERFASGDRDHRIEVRVPPELHRVAEEFNRMIERIRDSEAGLVDQARRDRLTGLLNRRAFDDALAEAFARQRRLDEPAALLMLDLDHFKRVNDGYGHAAGDDVLRCVAGAMLSSLRQIDKMFRIGGEEFAVLLPGADCAAAAATAERIRKRIAGTPAKIGGRDLSVTVSVGVALTRGISNADELVRAADAALYRAKRGGRNRVAAQDDAIASAADG